MCVVDPYWCYIYHLLASFNNIPYAAGKLNSKKIYWITKCTKTGNYLPFFSSLLKKRGKKKGE